MAAEFAIVTKRTLYPGQQISLADLKSVELVRKPSIQYRYVKNPQRIVGHLAKRTILAGRFIPVGSVKPAPIIKAGVPTRVEFRSGALSLSIRCVPLSDGISGQRVRFRNTSSGKIFTALIRKDGSAIVGVAQ